MAKAKSEKPSVLGSDVPEWASTTAIAKLLGYTVRRIQQLTQEGVLETEILPGGGQRRYRTCETVQRYIASEIEKTKEKMAGTDAQNLAMEKLRAEVELKKNQGQLHKLKIAIAEEKYIEAEAASEELRDFLGEFKRFILQIPTKTASIVAVYADKTAARSMEKSIREELEQMLADFVDGVGVDEHV